MKLNYTYRQTKTIKDDLRKLDIYKEVIDLLPKLPHIEENLRRKSLLKSSLFSARIEGNKLTLKEVSFYQRLPKELAKIEVFNILKALNFLYSKKTAKKLSKSLILKLHKFVLAGLSDSAGQLRKEPSAIFNQAGIAIYLCPPPPQVPDLLEKLIEISNSSKEIEPIKAAISHFAFEKIHPFLDGNGRVGRLIATFILKNSNYSFRGLTSPEEYFEKNRQDYYDLLENKRKDITEFVEFFLEGLISQAEEAMENLKKYDKGAPEDFLLPRRKEILEIIKDHKMVSFNFIKRRFLKVPASTLHYDLKQLQKNGFIKKLGTTRGVVYSVK